MQTAVHREYRRLRNAGWGAKMALETAKVKHAFAMSDAVRLDLEPDECPDVESLTGENCPERERERILDRADRDGVWGMVGRFRHPVTGEWEHADSVWGFVGDDWQDSGYDHDVRRSTLDAYRDACREARALATYGGI